MKKQPKPLEKQATRETFSTSLAVFFATLGSAVGLGNIWKFPYMTGMNGGAAFILVYLFFVLLIGIPIMVSEFYLGRRTRMNAVGVFDVLKGPKVFKAVGYMGMISAMLIMFFYSTVAGWVYSYVVKTMRGDFRSLKNLSIADAKAQTEAVFNATASGVQPMLWQALAVIVVAVILMLGVKKGIERVTKTLMPVLLTLIIIIAIRAMFLPGAGEGVSFLVKPDFSQLTTTSILSAMGLAFFKLSLGMGTMVTYGSYFNKENNLVGTSFKVAFSDVAVSILAGLAIFPVVFTFNLAPEGGPGLLFNTIPLVFSLLPFGNLLLMSFFILSAIAATTAMVSMVEVPVAIFTEQFKISRKLSVAIITLVMFIIGVLTTHPDSVLGFVRVNGMNLFDTFDYMASNVLMPAGGLLITFFVGYYVKKHDLLKELTNDGQLGNPKLIGTFRWILRWVTPILLIIVFLNAMGLFK